MKKFIDDIRSFNQFYAGILHSLEQETGDLSAREIKILLAVQEAGETHATDIVTRCCMDKGTVNRALARLKRMELAEMIPLANDRRVLKVSLTTEGKKRAIHFLDEEQLRITAQLKLLPVSLRTELVLHMTAIKKIMGSPYKKDSTF